jgi:hypothetical protein
MPLLRQQHAHHRDLPARATAETQAHASSAKDQDRHLMMTKLMLDICKYDQCLCWLPADNVIPCVVTSMLPFGKTQKRKIALLRRSVTRSQPNSRYAAWQNCVPCRLVPPHRRLRPRRNPHSCGTTAVPNPRFPALALFGRRPSECVERPSFRRPKTCTIPEVEDIIRSPRRHARAAMMELLIRVLWRSQG